MQQILIPILSLWRKLLRHLIALYAEHFSELLGCLPTMFIVIQAQNNPAYVWVVSQIGPQSSFVQPTQCHRVGGYFPVQGAEAHQVDWGLKDKDDVISRITAKAECNIFIAAWDIPLKAAAVPIIGSSLIGKYRRS